MRKLVLMIAQCLLLAGCTGLPTPREMGDMALLRTVGVDGGGNDITLTVSTGDRAGGSEGEKAPPLILTGRGSSLAAAAADLRQQSDSWVFFGHADQVLLGRETELLSVLSWLAHDAELSLGANVWLLGEGNGAIAVENGGEAGVEKRLAALERDAKLGAAPMTRTAGELYSALLDRGCAFLPVLTGAGELSPGGYALVNGGGVTALLAGEEARGLELLCEHPMAEVIEVSLPEGEVSVRLVGGQLDCKPRFESGELKKLELRSRVSGKLCQWDGPVTPEQREAITAEVSRRLYTELAAALNRLQTEKTECAGIGSRVAIAAPWHWAQLEGRWQEVFGALDWELEVRFTLD